MMDVTPLDIRKKKSDFTRGLRGYDPQEVDQFLDLVADRLEEVVKVNLTLRARVERLADRVEGQEGRERAVQEALVTAQSLKHDIQDQARREADLIQQEAEASAERVHEGVKQILQSRAQELAELNQARSRFLEGFRSLLERELDFLQAAESNPPDDEFDLDVGVSATRDSGSVQELQETVAEAEIDQATAAPVEEGETAEDEVVSEEPDAPEVDAAAEEASAAVVVEESPG